MITTERVSEIKTGFYFRTNDGRKKPRVSYARETIDVSAAAASVGCAMLLS